MCEPLEGNARLSDGFAEIALLNAFCADIRLYRPFIDVNAQFLQVGKEFAFCTAYYLAAGPAFLLQKTFSGDFLACLRPFTT
jgi:hypothetical protein